MPYVAGGIIIIRPFTASAHLAWNIELDVDSNFFFFSTSQKIKFKGEEECELDRTMLHITLSGPK